MTTLTTLPDRLRSIYVYEGANYVQEAAREIERLTAEVAGLREDAERYRWLRNNPDWLGWDHDFRPDEVDREIDAARKGEA